MTKTVVPEGLFKPRLSGSETKAKVTTEAARSIIKDEAAARQEKTKRLRAARLAREAKEEATPASAGKKTRKRAS